MGRIRRRIRRVWNTVARERARLLAHVRLNRCANVAGEAGALRPVAADRLTFNGNYLARPR